MQAADRWTNIQNRLKVVTGSAEELTKVTRQLDKVSERSRSSFADNVEVFARLAIGGKETGATNEQLIRVTETLAKLGIVGSASTAEMNAGLLQLAQGMASGVLRGEELNSVLENLPLVARAIAMQLGVPIGKLREMGSAGKITGRQVVDALLAASAGADEAFAKTQGTVGQAFTVLKDNWTQLLGTFNETTAAGQALTDIIFGISDGLELMTQSARNGLLGDLLVFFRDAFGYATDLLGIVYEIGTNIDHGLRDFFTGTQRFELSDSFAPVAADVMRGRTQEVHDPQTKQVVRAVEEVKFAVQGISFTYQ